MSRSALFMVVVSASLACSEAAEEVSPEALYAEAVADAAVVEAGEVHDGLVAIRDDNAELYRDGMGRVRMVTWTSWDGYDAMVGGEIDLAVEVWTTVAPQLQEFCQAEGLAGEALTLRLEQLLGLPPNDGKDRLVELWVPPEGMFRPSPDPEIDDAVASLEFPAGVAEDHRTWIEDLRAASYGEDGYPWTQLGYTYDWSPDAASEVGLSEFVVRAGTTVYVGAVTPTDEYCR